MRLTLSAASRGLRARRPLDVFTMASDPRAAELAVLLESLRAYPHCRVRVIPFDDRLDLVRGLCDLYGAELLRPEPEWDDLGRVIYKESRTRRNESWRYFRKLNAFGYAQGDFAFLDSNVVVYDDPRSVLDSRERFDVAFGARSNPGRNFKPWGRYVLRHLDDRLREGYQAAFWFVRAGSVDPASFLELARYPNLRDMLGTAPEQAVLNLVLVLERRTLRLVSEVCPAREFLVCGRGMVGKTVPIVAGVPRKNDVPVIAAKWAGDYHGGRFAFPCAHLHIPLARRVLDRVAADDPALHVYMAEGYASLYGAPVDVRGGRRPRLPR